MIFDTDVLIWVQRGNIKAAEAISHEDNRYISLQTYLELQQEAENKKQHRYIKQFLHEFNIKLFPFSENIGHRAAVYIEEYSLSSGLRAGDAIIAATAVENNMSLFSGDKHMSSIKELELIKFQP